MNKIDKIRREIAFLRKAKLNNEITEHHKITKCPCCYTKLTTKNTVNMLHCEHALCKKCHIHWFDDQHKNTCPLCRKKNYKSLELSNGLSTIINEKVNQLDDLETDISNYNTILEDKRDEHQWILQDINIKNDKIKSLRKKIKNLKKKKTDHKYNNLACKLKWNNNPKLGIQYWEKKYNKQQKGIECKQRNFHHIMLNEYKNLAYQFNHKNEYIKPNTMIKMIDAIKWMDGITKTTKEEENNVDVEFTEYEMNELFYEDDSNYKENESYTSLGSSNISSIFSDSDSDLDDMPELVEAPIGYRDEDLFDSNTIRTPELEEAASQLGLPYNSRDAGGAIVGSGPYILPSFSDNLTRHIAIPQLSSVVRERIFTAVMGLTDEEIEDISEGRRTFSLQE